MATIANLVVKIAADVAELKQGLLDSQSSFQKAARNMQQAGRDLSAAVTLPLAAIGYASAKAAADFETQTTRLVTLSGVGEDQMHQFRDSILALAPAVGIGPGELAKGMLAVTSTGIRGAEALDILKVSAKASADGLGDVYTVALTVTSVVNAYGAANISAARAADVLYQTVVEGNAEASTLAPQLGKVVGLASDMGVSFEEVGASIATFTRLGVDAETATISLRQILASLLNPSAQARKAMEDLGTSADSLRQSIKERGLADTLIGLMHDAQGNSDAIGQLFGNIRALSGVLGTAGSQADAYRTILEHLQQSTGVVDDAFNRTAQTASFMFNSMKAQLETIMVSVGQQIMPTLESLATNVLQPLLQDLGALVAAFGQLPPGIQQGIVAFLAAATALGPVLLSVGTLSKGLLSLSALFKGEAVAGVLAFLTPVGEIAAVVAGAGLALSALGVHVGDLASSFGHLALDGIAGAFEDVKTAVGHVTDAAKDQVDYIQSTLDLAWQGYKVKVAQPLQDFWTRVGQTIAQSVDQGLNSPAGQAYQGFLDKAFIQPTDRIASGLGTAFSNIASGLGDAFVNMTHLHGVMPLSTVDAQQMADAYRYLAQVHDDENQHIIVGAQALTGLIGALPRLSGELASSAQAWTLPQMSAEEAAKAAAQGAKMINDWIAQLGHLNSGLQDSMQQIIDLEAELRKLDQENRARLPGVLGASGSADPYMAAFKAYSDAMTKISQDVSTFLANGLTREEALLKVEPLRVKANLDLNAAMDQLKQTTVQVTQSTQQLGSAASSASPPLASVADTAASTASSVDRVASSARSASDGLAQASQTASQTGVSLTQLGQGVGVLTQQTAFAWETLGGQVAATAAQFSAGLSSGGVVRSNVGNIPQSLVTTGPFMLPNGSIYQPPHFATGAYVPGPTLAVVGDTPGGEYVLRRDQLAAMIGGSRGGSVTVTVPVTIQNPIMTDARALDHLGDVFGEALIRKLRASGIRFPNS